MDEAEAQAYVESQEPDEAEPENFPVWADNREALEVFLRLRTQWRVAVGMVETLYLGLDYAGLEAALRMIKTSDKRTLFADLQVMEFAALEVLNRG